MRPSGDTRTTSGQACRARALSRSYADEDARKPIVSAGFNTEAGIEAALRRRSGFRRRGPVPADADEARWDFAFWSHKDLARFGDPSRDPDGAEALNRWIRDRRLWYDADPRDVSDERFDRLLELDEAIDDGLIHVLATVAERVQRDTVRWVVARPVPVLIHASDHSAELAAASRRANPAGLTDEYAAWGRGTGAGSGGGGRRGVRGTHLRLIRSRGSAMAQVRRVRRGHRVRARVGVAGLRP